MSEKESFLTALAVPAVRGLTPYEPGKPIEELQRELGLDDIVKLASNESPVGVSPRARAAIEALLPELTRYPDGGGYLLKHRLAELHDVEPARITLGNGSNELLTLLARAYLDPARDSVFSQYAFIAHALAVHGVGAVARVAEALPADAEQPLGHDLDAMAALVGDRTRLVYIANPNNPTGTWLEAEALGGFIENLPESAIAIVDEAYHHFADVPGYASCLPLVGKHRNLIVTRTFSKAYGLAGLRVGYMISHPDISKIINGLRDPFNVNSVALAAALAVLDDSDYLQRAVEINASGLEQLRSGLGRLQLAVPRSAGNFVLADTGADAAPLYRKLLERGVIARPVANYGLPRHLRISIGTADENDRLLQALEAVYAGPGDDPGND